MIGYKLAAYYDGTYFQPCIVTLYIPNDATVINPYTPHSWTMKAQFRVKSKKHRCNKARVMTIEDLQTGNFVPKAYSLFVLVNLIEKYGGQLSYRLHLIIERYIGKCPGSVYEPSEKPICLEEINEDEFLECGKGIHFFLTKQDVKDYCNPKNWGGTIIEQINFYICQEKI